MRYGVFLTVRLASTRLAQKHLAAASGRTMLEWLIGRCRHAVAPDETDGRAKLVIATTTEDINNPLVDYERLGVAVFRGDVHNIPLRHLQAAEATGVEAIVSVDGDDILCAPEAMLAVRDGLAKGYPGVRTEGLPFGMNAMGYRTDFLRKSLAGKEKAQLETGWGRLFDMSAFETVHFSVPGNDDTIRLTLDYDEDRRLFEALFEKMGDGIVGATPEKIVACIRENGLDAITRGRVEEYWENFRRGQEKDERET